MGLGSGPDTGQCAVQVVQPILQQLRSVIARMPADLQQTMLSSPARASLLQHPLPQ